MVMVSESEVEVILDMSRIALEAKSRAIDALAEELSEAKESLRKQQVEVRRLSLALDAERRLREEKIESSAALPLDDDDRRSGEGSTRLEQELRNMSAEVAGSTTRMKEAEERALCLIESLEQERRLRLLAEEGIEALELQMERLRQELWREKAANGNRTESTSDSFKELERDEMLEEEQDQRRQLELAVRMMERWLQASLSQGNSVSSSMALLFDRQAEQAARQIVMSRPPVEPGKKAGKRRLSVCGSWSPREFLLPETVSMSRSTDEQCQEMNSGVHWQASCGEPSETTGACPSLVVSSSSNNSSSGRSCSLSSYRTAVGGGRPESPRPLWTRGPASSGENFAVPEISCGSSIRGSQAACVRGTDTAFSGARQSSTALSCCCSRSARAPPRTLLCESSSQPCTGPPTPRSIGQPRDEEGGGVSMDAWLSDTRARAPERGDVAAMLGRLVLSAERSGIPVTLGVTTQEEQ